MKGLEIEKENNKVEEMMSPLQQAAGVCLQQVQGPTLHLKACKHRNQHMTIKVKTSAVSRSEVWDVWLKPKPSTLIVVAAE